MLTGRGRRLGLAAFRLHERVQEPPAGRGAHLHARPVGAHSLARAAHDLPARRLALAKDLRDLAVTGVEHLMQQERRALLRREPLEHREERDREVGGKLGGLVGARRRLGDQWLGEPGTDVAFALGAQLA